MELFTFAISHFSEKARWALDAAELPYREKMLMPGIHIPIVRWLAPKTCVPVLRIGRRVVQGSSAIIDIAAARNGSAPVLSDGSDPAASRALEAEFDRAFGRSIQTLFYAEGFDGAGDILLERWCHGAPTWAPGFYRATWPALAAVVTRMYRSRDEDEVRRAGERFLAGLDTVDQALARAPYLGGAAPNRVDLTVAALLSPMLSIGEHPAPWHQWPPKAAALASPHFDRPVFQHVRRMYRQHRHGTGVPYCLGPGGAHMASPHAQSTTTAQALA